jgi:hypothetical protein
MIDSMIYNYQKGNPYNLLNTLYRIHKANLQAFNDTFPALLCPLRRSCSTEFRRREI